MFTVYGRRKIAEFKTHLSVACMVSGLAATSLLVAGIANSKEVVLYFTLGSIGGVLPDVDSDNSVPVKLTFNVLALVVGFLVIFSQRPGCSVAELFLIWLASFILVKYIAFHFFARLTVHRGIIHSIPAAVLGGLLTTIVLNRLYDCSEFTAWMAGFFLFFGFIVHLVLDELYSVNLFGAQVKSSLGTAFKLGNFKDLKTTVLIYVAILVLFWFTPDPTPFFKIVLNKLVTGHN